MNDGAKYWPRLKISRNIVAMPPGFEGRQGKPQVDYRRNPHAQSQARRVPIGTVRGRRREGSMKPDRKVGGDGIKRGHTARLPERRVLGAPSASPRRGPALFPRLSAAKCFTLWPVKWLSGRRCALSHLFWSSRNLLPCKIFSVPPFAPWS